MRSRQGEKAAWRTWQDNNIKLKVCGSDLIAMSYISNKINHQESKNAYFWLFFQAMVHHWPPVYYKKIWRENSLWQLLLSHLATCVRRLLGDFNSIVVLSPKTRKSVNICAHLVPLSQCQWGFFLLFCIKCNKNMIWNMISCHHRLEIFTHFVLQHKICNQMSPNCILKH